MQQKKDVDYSRGMGNRRCKNCRYFAPHSMKCSRVYGLIDPMFWCRLFAPKR